MAEEAQKNNDRVSQLNALLAEADGEDIDALLYVVGLCPECEQLVKHHMDEPFASCGCRTGEETGDPPWLQQLLRKRHQWLTNG